MENRNGLLVDFAVDEPMGRRARSGDRDVRRGAAGKRRITVGGDKGYDTSDFVEATAASAT